MRGLLCLGGPLLLAVATPAAAQSGQLPPPPPPVVSQSEPGYGPLRDLHQALTIKQANFNRMRQDHIAKCDRIPPSDTARIEWCRGNVRTLGRERSAYDLALREYNAKQAFYQGRTLYKRKNYDGAIAKYEQARSMLPAGSQFEGNIEDELDLARAAKSLAANNGEAARGFLQRIIDRGAICTGWLTEQFQTLSREFDAWIRRNREKVNKGLNPLYGRPGTCAIRG